MSVVVSPFLAALTVGVGVPIALGYVYGVVPISLCRSGGCTGVITSRNGHGVNLEFNERDDTYMINSLHSTKNSPTRRNSGNSSMIDTSSVLAHGGSVLTVKATISKGKFSIPLLHHVKVSRLEWILASTWAPSQLQFIFSILLHPHCPFQLWFISTQATFSVLTLKFLSLYLSGGEKRDCFWRHMFVYIFDKCIGLLTQFNCLFLFLLLSWLSFVCMLLMNFGNLLMVVMIKIENHWKYIKVFPVKYRTYQIIKIDNCCTSAWPWWSVATIYFFGNYWVVFIWYLITVINAARNSDKLFLLFCLPFLSL